MFDASEQRFLREAATHLAQGARRSLLFGEATDPEGPQAPGVLVLTEDWHVESTTPGDEQLLSDLPDGDIHAGRLPSAVLAVAGRALRIARSGDLTDVALARVLTRTGTWMVLHGAVLQSGTEPRVSLRDNEYRALVDKPLRGGPVLQAVAAH